MPTVSYDGQSFQIDGRRIWLVSGAIHYARTPRELWRSRIRAAKQAGLNCIETYVFWNIHEPRPGVFNFEGDADLRAFIKLIQEENLCCILRPGPYICAEWDFGGLPAWLHRVVPGKNGDALRLREANGPFLEACARYLGAVMEQVKDLQVTVSPPGRKDANKSNGPIVLVQAENEWFCHNPEQGEGYLREIVRYLRESGCDVPINVCNNLWQRTEGAIDTWNANQHLASDLRQLRVVQPNAPLLVTEFWPGWFDYWGHEHHRAFTPEWNSYRLAQILASGGQYNLYMFHGGTNFGFHGGRTVAAPGCFITTSYDYDAPLREAGGRGAKFHAVRRISTFASQFANLFAHLDPSFAHATVSINDNEKDHPLSIIHQRGTQGDVVFLLKSETDRSQSASVMLNDGRSITVPIGDDRAAWFVLDANLGGIAELSYTNLRPWAFAHKQLLVLFGPAGADGVIAINGAAWNPKVPTGRVPLIERHEDLTVIVLNHELLDATYITPTGMVIGAAGLDDKHEPIALDGWANITIVSDKGEVKKISPKPVKASPAPRLGKWRRAGVAAFVDGSSSKFKTIDGPASLESLKVDFGYGWYRVASKAKSISALAPGSGDRLHVFTGGKAQGVLGLGPGAENVPTDIKLDQDTVVLADNLGRFNFGWGVGETKGLNDHLYDVKPARLGKPQIVEGKSPDPFELGGFFVYLRRGEESPADAVVWKLKTPAAKRSLVLDLVGFPHRAMLFVNHRPIGLYDKGMSAGFARFLIEPGRGAGVEIKLALFEKLDGKNDFADTVKLYEATAATDDATWAFAPWTVPTAKEFTAVEKTSPGQPCWHRAEFSVSDPNVPLWLEPAGMSKGQIYLNGHNVGRYFVATAAGKAVPPQERYYLPEPWLKIDVPNELILFDEHGKSAEKCRLIYDPMGPYGE